MRTKYRLEDKIPIVNFGKEDVYYISINESGSSPYTIEKTIISKDKENLMVIFISPDGPDAVPRTFVVQNDKKHLKNK